MAIGYYKYADRLVVPDEAGARSRARQIDRWLASLRRIDRATLEPAVRADWAMLENQFSASAGR